MEEKGFDGIGGRRSLAHVLASVISATNKTGEAPDVPDENPQSKRKPWKIWERFLRRPKNT